MLVTYSEIMSLEYDDEETDRLLAAADDIDFVGESQPRTSPELLGAAETPAFEATKSTAGMAPREESDGELRRGEGLWGPLSLFQTGGSADIFHRNGRRGATTRFEEACYFCRCGLGSGTFSRASSHRKPSLTSTCVRQEF